MPIWVADRETSTALVRDYGCGTGLFCMAMKGGDLMGHCDDVRMDGRANERMSKILWAFAREKMKKERIMNHDRKDK